MKPAPTIAIAAERLTADTGEAWTAERVLRALAEHHFRRQEWRPTILVSIPGNWPLIDAETGEPTAVPFRATARVGHAYFYLWQILDGAQEGDAAGAPLELEIEGRRFTTPKPLPASAIRLQDHDIAALAQSEAPEQQTLTTAPAAGTIHAPPPKPSRRRAQLETILDVCRELEFDPMKIPVGGKTQIEKVCRLRSAHLFSSEAFREAWKVALSEGVVRTAHHEKYRGGSRRGE